MAYTVSWDANPLVASINRRAMRIADRVMPLGPTPHGFHDPQAFIDSCIASANRNRFYRAVNDRLIEKAIAKGELALVGNRIVPPPCLAPVELQHDGRWAA